MTAYKVSPKNVGIPSIFLDNIPSIITDPIIMKYKNRFFISIIN